MENAQALHPSVLYFSNCWNGWKFWMSYCSYPDNYENPCIAVSNKPNSEWTTPYGLLNPLDFPFENGTLSDPELVYNPSTDELWLYYRYTSPISARERIYRKISKNGVDWSDRVVTSLQQSDKAWQFISPTVLLKGSLCYLWCVDRRAAPEPFKLFRYQSVDGLQWVEKTECSFDKNFPYPLTIWHPDIIYIDKTQEYYYKSQRMYFAKSLDGLHWRIDSLKEFIRLGKHSKWDHDAIYRGSLIFADQILHVWYTGIHRNQWRIGYTNVRM